MSINLDLNKTVEQISDFAQKKKDAKLEKESLDNKVFKEFFADSSYEFYQYAEKLVNAGKDWVENYNEDFIGWHLLKVDGKSIQLIQQKEDAQTGELVYHVNPIYYDGFKAYFEEYIKPQL